MIRESVRLLSILLCIGIPCVAWGQRISDSTKNIDTAGLVIESTVGWENSADPSTPVPVSFLIENFSDETIEGRMLLRAPHNNDRTMDLGEVFIGPASKRRFTAIRGDLDNIYECYAEIQNNNKVLWRRQLPVNMNYQFSQDTIHCLFIDNAQRSLRLPTAKTNAPRNGVADKSGRAVKTFTVKSWQVPDHPGPLSVAQGIVFREEFDTKLLNRAQWNAIANWMCQGGTIFVHEKSKEVIQKLLVGSPLTSSAPIRSDDQFIVRDAGLGRICEYTDALFSSTSNTRKHIANRLSLRPSTRTRAVARQSEVHRRTSGNASWNRLFLLAFFVIYAVLSGVVTMVLFRLSRRQIAVYTVSVVAGACVAAAILGGALRFSRGDLRWVSVTQPGVGGLMQVAKLEASSGGARATNIAVSGDNIDLQVNAARRRWQWNDASAGYPAFTWQPNLAKDSEDTYQIDAAMTPWGGRQMIGTAFKRTEGRLDFELEFSPGPGKKDQTESPSSPEESNEASDEDMEPNSVAKFVDGQFRVRVKNNLPFDLTDCRVIVGATTKFNTKTGDLMAQREPWRRNQFEHFGSGSDAQIDVYQVFSLPNLAANGAPTERTADAHMNPINYQWSHRFNFNEGVVSPPRISRIGTASAWIIGTIESSPIIKVDENKSSFSVNDEFHIYMQEIRPEDMPDAGVFLEADTKQ